MKRPTIYTGLQTLTNGAFICAGLIVLFLAVMPGRLLAQTYTIDQTRPISLETLTSPTTVSLSDDQTSGPYSIGFNFEFFGVSYSQFYISSNGFLAFQNTSNGCCSGQFIPNTGQPNNMIAAFYEDYDPPEGGSIRYQTLGSAGNRILVLEFNGIYPWNGPPKTPSTWQIKLFECVNEIEIHCLSCNSDGGSHTQGIENAAGTVAYTVAGRNSADFNLSNDVVAFVPDGGGFTPISLGDASASIDENIATGSDILTLSATDPDVATLEYTIVSGNDLGLFNLGLNSGELTVANSVDYEAVFGVGDDEIVLEVQVVDASNSCRIDFADVTISINNEDEVNSTISSTSLTNLSTTTSIAQSFVAVDPRDLLSVAFYFNSSPGSGTLNIYSGDGLSARGTNGNTAGKTEALVYSQAIAGLGTGVQTLELDQQVTLSAGQSYTVEFTSASSFSAWFHNADIYVRGSAYLGGIAQPTRDMYFSVAIGPFNAAPVLDPIDNVTIVENTDASETVVAADASDPDGNNLSYSLAGGGGYFVIDPNTGEVTTNGVLDYENIFANTTISPLQYTITVTVTDDGATPKSDSESFVVTIENEDDLPYTVGIASANITLNGNSSIGQSFTTTDAGLLTEFVIDVVTAPASGFATVQFWQNSDLNTTSGGTGPGHSETNLLYQFQAAITSTGIQTITLPTPLAVEGFTVYSMEMFSLGMNLRYRSSNLYRRGRILWSNQLYGCCDLYFVATISGGGAGAAGGIDLLTPLNGTNLSADNLDVTFTWDGDGDGQSDYNARSEDITYALHLQADGRPELVFEGIETEGYVLSLLELESDTEYAWWVEDEDTGGETAKRYLLTPSGIELIVTGIQDPLFSMPMEAYPNPFADGVQIKFGLKEIRDAKVVIYDLRGAKVAELPMQQYTTEGVFTWDGTSSQGNKVGAGMYTYSLQLYEDGNLERTINGQLVKR